MDLVCIGKIIKPQGLKGEVKIYPLISTSAVFNNKIEFYINKKLAKIETCSFRNGFGYAKFEEITDRTVAEKYRNFLVYIKKEDFYKYSKTEVLIEDLIGETLCDENGNFVGQIMGVENFGTHDLIIIKESDERLYQLPFVSAIFKSEKDKMYIIKKEYEGARVDYED